MSVHQKNTQPLYELNYQNIVTMLPDIQAFEHVTLSSDDHRIQLAVDVIERTPYTTLIKLTSRSLSLSEFAPHTCLQVRIYHDAKVAEVLTVQGKRNIRPHYQYPNQNGYLPDEKRQNNKLLAEMLVFCGTQNYKKTYVPQHISIDE